LSQGPLDPKAGCVESLDLIGPGLNPRPVTKKKDWFEQAEMRTQRKV